MKAEILCVGTELLLGDILNTNAQYLSQELAVLGINVYHQRVVGDNPDRVKEALKEAYKNVDLVITTGGLGPTKDDLTKEVIAEYFNKKLILDNEAMDRLTRLFERRGQKVTESNKKQAFIPEGAIVLQNDWGTAPGCIIEAEGKTLIMLPGPPKEVKPMFGRAKQLYLEDKCDKTFVSKVLKIFGIPEGDAADAIEELLNKENPTVAPYAKENEVTFRITAAASTKIEAENLIKPVSDAIKAKLGTSVYGEDEDTLDSVVVKLMLDKNLTIATAESCTGGLLAGALINNTGISKAYTEGYITYSNDVKIKNLGVSEDTLKQYGAVSEIVAKQMAEKAAEKAGTNIGLSTTGLAGPGGGSEEKPVGLVYIGCCINGETTVKRLMINGDRQKIRNRTVLEVLDLLRNKLLNM